MALMALRLVPASGGDAIEITAERAVLGRDPSADILIRDNSVSRKHAVLERRGAGWFVIDQQSANGTWIDDARVLEAPLLGGHQLRLGAIAFTVQLPEPPRPAVAAARPGAATLNRNQGPRTAASSAPAAPAPAANPATGKMTMTREEAAALLGVWAGSPPDDVRKQYQKIYNDLQIRLTNAPAPSLKRMYQKNIQDLKTAAEVLCPGIIG